ncbi:U-scoloptoxin(01)-Er1a-like [Bicyclus anynana]|uniref:U-scoloptoxin(01)-Er1a-like n=1 Tax=Bicyclus anynana TaxID=110368 RepID=A0ABM3LVJ7_BICAN|nr:U-scoloptoxin(01)-Er1a-like [Bicyclus anynana]
MLDRRICGLQLRSLGLMALLLHLVDLSTAALDGYVPGQDYPAFEEVPKGLSFTCDDKIPGYYADPETSCQVWHWCVPSIGGNIMYSFICAPGTVFNQRTRVCDWFFQVDCPNSPAFYGVNEDLYKDEAGNYIAGKKKRGISNAVFDRRYTTRQKRHEGRKRRINRQTTTT